MLSAAIFKPIGTVLATSGRPPLPSAKNVLAACDLTFAWLSMSGKIWSGGLVVASPRKPAHPTTSKVIRKALRKM